MKMLPAILICLLFGSHVIAEETYPPLNPEEPKRLVSALEATIPDLMALGHIPGMQAALVHNGKVIWSKGFGVKNHETGGAVTSNSIFEAASLTKPLFAYAVLRMVDEGLLDLDAPLKSYLPQATLEAEFGHSLDKDGFRRDWFAKINIGQILSHSAGTPHGERGDVYPLAFEPGTKYMYSADGYYLLQKAVEHLKGEPLEVVIENYVLGPLGMTRSRMVWSDEYETTAVNGHGKFSKPEDHRRRETAHAGATLYTTATEYARFVTAVLNGEGLKKKTLRTMLSPRIVMDEDLGLTWSLGFGIQQDTNGTAFWQWGDFGIFRNYVIGYPREKLALIYFTNSSNGLSICGELVTRTIGGRALGNESLDYYRYDSPRFELPWALISKGAASAPKLVAELRAQLPVDAFRSELLTAGQRLRREEFYDEAIALFKLAAEDNPHSGTAWSELGRAYMGHEDHVLARSAYRKALELEDEEVDTESVSWALDYVHALGEPQRLTEDYMTALAGSYEQRNVKFEGGRLFYFRENANAVTYRELVPLSSTTFMLKGVVEFRLRFEFNENGEPVGVLGLYEDGRQDRSARSQEPRRSHSD